MNTINIDKLEELNGFQWGYKNREFELRSLNKDCCKLYENNYLNMHGKIDFVGLKLISLKNLTELEFYGLKVILNEPKLTRKEREFLECHRDIYIARDYGGKINIYSKEPQESITSNVWFSTATQLQISNELFKFIVWESGKAWSKAELMELEVAE